MTNRQPTLARLHLLHRCRCLAFAAVAGCTSNASVPPPIPAGTPIEALQNVILGQTLADQLGTEIGDSITLHNPSNDAVKIRAHVGGVFETGLLEGDSRFMCVTHPLLLQLGDKDDKDRVVEAIVASHTNYSVVQVIGLDATEFDGANCSSNVQQSWCRQNREALTEINETVTQEYCPP